MQKFITIQEETFILGLKTDLSFFKMGRLQEYVNRDLVKTNCPCEFGVDEK